MTGIAKAIVGARIHDGTDLHDDHALIVHTDDRLSILPRQNLPTDCPLEQLEGGIIAPGYVDLQVNGGGGVMFNDDQSVETLCKIAKAHTAIGSAAILPTLITDTPERTRAAVSAVKLAIEQKIDGIIGIHLEGPHLSVARKGAHDPNLIRKMTDEDLALAINAAEILPNVMITIAPENVTHAQVRKMSDAGIIVSLGHSDASFDTCTAAFDAGAKSVTHLFNAMSQLTNREPGLVGAALSRDDIYAGLIADGIHVHPASMRVALNAKANDDRIFLVTDAMASAGSSIDSFTLNGRKILRENGRLTLEDGTLAGADLELTQAVSILVNSTGQSLASSIARATCVPASILPQSNGLGRLTNASQMILYIQDSLTGFTQFNLNAPAT